MVVSVKKTVFAASLAFATLVGMTAQATTINISTFDIDDFDAITTGGVIEDFEGFNSGTFATGTSTKVGTFSSTGGTGSGSVCNAQSGGNCQDLFISDTARSGQGNLVPLEGTKSLSSNDTNGIFWNVANAAGGVFNKIVFALRDAADIRNTVFTVRAGDGTTATLTGQANNNQQLVVIDLGASFSSATVSLFNNQTNDGFTIDGATVVNDLAPVPVPAAGLLLIGGLGALGAMRARKKAKAAA